LRNANKEDEEDKMKKAIGLLFVGLTILGGISTETYGDSGKGFHVGFGVGAFPVFIINSYYVSGELGYRFTKNLGMLIDAGFGNIASSYGYDENEGLYHYSYTSKTEYTTIPISGSLLFSTQVGENFIPYVGLGMGYYKIIIKEEWERQSSYSGKREDKDELEANGFSPHIVIGGEFLIFDQTAVFGELKYIVGRYGYEKADNDYDSEEKMPFGGTVARIGLRIYF
jgi:hypothetical protein